MEPDSTTKAAAASDPATVHIHRAVERLAQFKARRALSELRQATQARARARKRDARRFQELGAAIDRAGFADWAPAEVIGLLLVAREQYGETETARKLMRERGRQAGGGNPLPQPEVNTQPPHPG